MIDRWRRWWFPASEGLDLAICRIVVVATQLFLFLPFFMATPAEHVALVESGIGFDRPQWMIRAVAALLPPDRVAWSALVRGVYAVTVVAGLTTLVGYRTRVSALFFALGTWFLVSHAGSYGQIQHPEVVLGSFLLFLALSPSGRRLSLDARLAGRPRGETREAVWPLRLTQLLLAWSYFSNGFAKLAHSGLEWMNGYTLQQTLLNMALNWERPFGLWLARHHDASVALSVATLAFELSFPLAVFARRARPLYLLGGTLFHLLTWLAMNVIFLQHIVLYAAFLDLEGRERPGRRGVFRARASVVAVLLATSLALAGASCGDPPPEVEAPVSTADARGIEGLDPRSFDSLPWAPGSLDRATGTYRLPVPRPDLVVTVDGVRLTSREVAAGWVAFKPIPGGAVLTAELPLLADEVNPVLSAALLHDLRVTSLHPHFTREQPRLLFLHLVAIGETDSLASAMGAVLQTLEDVKGQPREIPPPIDPGLVTFYPAPVDSILRVRGRMRDGGYEITLPRSATLEGFDLGESSGVASRVTFAGGRTSAVVRGRLALIETELQPVLKALRAAGIEIASIDDAAMGEVPNYVHVHIWGRGSATALAQAIRDALDAMER